MITVERKSTESNIKVSIEPGVVPADYRKRIETPILFLNHMIEQMVWRGGIGIEAKVTLDQFPLEHVVCEDLGMTLGKAIGAYCKANPVAAYGDATGIIDEARARAVFSFENRAGFFFESDVEIPAVTEKMQSEDLTTFLDGLTQGACCTLHLKLEKGENGHHIWEAAFRAVGLALSRALAAGSGRTAGVAGEITYEITE